MGAGGEAGQGGVGRCKLLLLLIWSYQQQQQKQQQPLPGKGCERLSGARVVTLSGCTHTRTHMHTRTHVHPHTHTHTHRERERKGLFLPPSLPGCLLYFPLGTSSSVTHKRTR